MVFPSALDAITTGMAGLKHFPSIKLRNGKYLPRSLPMPVAPLELFGWPKKKKCWIGLPSSMGISTENNWKNLSRRGSYEYADRVARMSNAESLSSAKTPDKARLLAVTCTHPNFNRCECLAVLLLNTRRQSKASPCFNRI